MHDDYDTVYDQLRDEGWTPLEIIVYGWQITGRNPPSIPACVMDPADEWYGDEDG